MRSATGRDPQSSVTPLSFLPLFVLGGWSAVAKLDSAVTAPGIVAVENSRKSVQHLEGGIVDKILVQEGQASMRAKSCSN